MMRIKFISRCVSLIFLIAGFPNLAASQLLTEKIAPRVCVEGVVDPQLLLGEVYLMAGANQAFIGTRWKATGFDAPAPRDIVATKFFITQPISAEGVSDDQLASIHQAGDDLLENFLNLRGTNPDDVKKFRLRTEPQKALVDDDIFETLGAFFQGADEPGPRLFVLCPSLNGKDGTKPPEPVVGSRLILAVRGNADDLMISSKDSAAFKKASSSQLAFVDNDEAGTTSFDVNTVIGIGASFPSEFNTPFRAIAYAHYKNTDQDTDDPTDDDSAGDIEYLTLGGLVSGRYFAPAREPDGFGLISNYGLSIGYTQDIENDAESIRGRLVFNDIVLDLPGVKSSPCGGPSTRFLFVDLPGNLYVDCSIELYLEGSYVFGAGSNADFQSLEDDAYFGIGAKSTLNFGINSETALKGFGIRLSGEYMGVVAGGLSDPHRLEAALTYKFPKQALGSSNLSSAISLGYSTGQDMTTFQDEDLFRLGFEIKY